MRFEKLTELSKLGCRDFDPRVTIQQIKGTNLMGYFSWGVEKIGTIGKIGLLLKVNGHHHKGWVYITLGFMDTYNVYLLNNQYNVKSTIEDVYCDQLFEVIDNRIERIQQYVD
jgi:hypothetical protein